MQGDARPARGDGARSGAAPSLYMYKTARKQGRGAGADGGARSGAAPSSYMYKTARKQVAALKQMAAVQRLWARL